MPYPELLLRPDLGKRAYRLRCRFAIDAFPREWFLEKAKYAAAQRFVEDMAKQGWEHIQKFGFQMKGPFSALTVPFLPKRALQEKWHFNARYPMPRRISSEGAPAYVGTVPLLGESEKWEYELAGVFIHKTILTELGPAHKIGLAQEKKRLEEKKTKAKGAEVPSNGKSSG